MLEQVITKVISLVDYLPAETLTQIRTAMLKELSQYELVPKSTDLVPYTGAPQILKLFLASKKVDGASAETLKNYRLVLTKFLSRMQKDPLTITTVEIRMYLALREQEGLSRKSVSTLLAILKSFFGWLENEDYISKSPCRKIPSIKTEKRCRKHLTGEELERLRMECKTARDKAIIEFFYSTGCRLDEVHKLNLSDINWKDDSCMVIGKGNKERKVYINDRARLYLQNYIKTRTDNNNALFVSERKPHNRLGKRMLEKIISRLGVAAGINRPIFPHLLRHTMATHAYYSGATLPQIQAMLGHESASTTQIYAATDQEEIRSAHRKHVA
ncbi:MAG: tyrosine-type recombinase/integrase [Clostridia bacterium]|nr:tyrosine-type recombinase/integrase [Clostridia bacterium]